MSKPLAQMSNEELWELFPIVLQPHNPQWTKWYHTEKVRLANLLNGMVYRLHHVGSTSVPGLTAKPTIDILAEIYEETDLDALTATLEGAGWIASPQPEKPAPSLMFLKGYTPEGFGEQVFHLHLRFPGDHDELYFRDWLMLHPDTAEEYAQLKHTLAQQHAHDRDAYTNAKADFVRTYTEKARCAYGGRHCV